MKKFIALLLIVPMLSGCAVGMALSGKRDRDISAVRRDMHREDVMFHMGADNLVGQKTTEEGSVDVFEIQKGNAPSVGRAVGHLVLDVLTYGIWEIIGTPLEAAGSDMLEVTVYYDKEDMVTKITAKEKGK